MIDESTIQIIKYVAIALDVVVLLGLIIHLLKGLKKGVLRTSLVLATKLVPLIIFFIFSGAIAKNLINTEVTVNGETQSVNELVYENVMGMFPEKSFEELKEMGIIEIVDSVSIMAVRVVICIAFAILVFVLISPLLRFILFLAIPNIRKNKPKLLSRLLGMGVAAAGYIALFCIFALPIYGIIEIATTGSIMMANVDESTEESTYTLQEGVSSSVILKLTSKIDKSSKGQYSFGIAAKRLGQVFRIKINKTTVNIVKEADNLLPIVPKVLEMTNSEESSNLNEMIKNFTDEDIDLITKSLGESKLLTVAWPVVVNYLEKEESNIEMLQTLSLNYEKLRSIDINEDIKNSSKLLKITLRFLKRNDLEHIDMSIIENDDNINDLIDALNAAYEIKLFEEVFPKALYTVLYDSLKETDYAFIIDLIEPEYFRSDFSGDVTNLAKAYIAIKNSKIIDYFAKKEGEYAFTNETKEQLETAKSHILKIKLLSKNYSALVAQLSKFVPDMIPVDFEAMSKEDINWNDEIGLLIDFLISGYKLMVTSGLDFDNPLSMLENDATADCICEMIDIILKSSMADKYYLPAIQEFIVKYTEGTPVEQYQSYFTIEYLKTGLKDDIVSIIELYRTSKELGLDNFFKEDGEFNIDLNDPEVEEKVKSFIHKLLYLKIVEGNENDLWNKILELSKLDQYGTFDEPTDDTDWSKEKPLLEDIILSILDLKGVEEILGSDEELDILEQKEWVLKIAKLLDNMAKSSLTKSATFDIFNQILGVVGYEIELTDLEKEQVVKNTFEKEFTTLLDLIELENNTFEKDENGNIIASKLSGDSVASIMLKASDSIIASKIVGKMLMDDLGTNGLNILPLDDKNESVYDFTNPKVLKDSAPSIAALIDLYVAIEDVDKDNMTDDVIENLEEALSKFASDDIDNDLVGDFLSEICNDNNINITDGTDWKNESMIVSEILSQYKDTENKDDFTIDNEELLESLDNSTAAKSILKYLGIIK